MKNYYHILGLSNWATTAEIRKAYRALALRNHPDRGGSEEKMKEINGAYEYLMKNKEQYDLELRPIRPQVITNGFTIIVGGFDRSWSFNGNFTTTTGGQ